MLMQLLSSFRKKNKAKRVPARRPWRRRLYCEPLEDRCLLSVSLSGPSESLVGSPGTWAASANDLGPNPVYQFSVTPAGGVSQMVQDFSASNSFTWNTLEQGSYTIQVTAKSSYTATSSETASASYTADSRITGNSAVVNATNNPLVALFSAPPTSGSSMYVQFAPDVANPTWLDTSSQSIVPGESTNFLVAGLLPNTTYLMRYVVDNGTPSTSLTFTTGSLPANLTFPSVTEPQPAGPDTDQTDNMVLHMGLPTGKVSLFATDLSGNIDWYYDPSANSMDGYATELVPGGTILFLGGTLIGAGGESVLKEMDLAGDTVRETNISAINAQLSAQDQISYLSHEALRLPNGYTAVIANNSEFVTNSTFPNGTTYGGNEVIVLDQNFQVKWVWNAFDYLDTNRLPTNGEGPGDWLHANSISYSPEDGDLLISLRAQDWVIKIDYGNGAGDGHVVWRLGQGGDFTAISSDSYPWFTHQHDAVYVNDNTLVLFDDGNTRVAQQGGDSRGQEWVLNEQTMTATLMVDVDLGNYSPALGAAQVLSNGNLDFTSGSLGGAGQSIEVSPNGVTNYVQQMSGLEYRSYFMSNLYGGNNFDYGLLDTGFERPSLGTGESAYQYDPTGSSWSFSGEAGLAGNGSAVTSGNPNAPQGTQVAFLQGTGSTISQVAFSLAPGTYQLSASAAQAGNNGTNNDEEVEVEVDGVVVTAFTPSSTSYATYSTPLFNLTTAGNHTIAFVGVGPAGAEYTALLDQVNLVELPSGAATFLKTDTTTQGSWQGTYGSQGYNVIDNASNYPSYAQVSASGNSNWIWSSSTSDIRALQDAVGTSRIAACWYSGGSFTVNVNITDGQTHQLALYLLDWDAGGARAEQVQILDASTGKVLSTENASNFQNGEYLVWNVGGDINIRFTNLGGANAVVSGIFFDPPGSPPPPPPPPPPGSASFLGSDTTTEGNWQGVYGSDGYNVIDNAVNYPSYAHVSATGISNWIWSTSTTDPEALQDASGSGRIAACWYSGGAFTVNVDITDGQTHRLALYLLDWQGGSRSEQIQIIDAATGNVLSTENASNFQNGEYLVWNVGGDINIRFTNLGGANAVVSGIFFDPPGSPPPPPPPPPPGSASFLGSDATTQGSWQGTYGGQGYNVIDNAVNYPSYAQVSASGNSNWIWSSSTSDPRALQDAVGSSRIAACWYSGSNFTVNVDITDGKTHQLALYLLDWDSGNARSEQVQITDATTGNVLSTEYASNFQNGEYLIWNVGGDINITFTSLAGPNAVLSGMFFG